MLLINWVAEVANNSINLCPRRPRPIRLLSHCVRAKATFPSCSMTAGSAGISLWSIFERDLDLFRRQDRTDVSARLLIAGSNDSRPALVTPPDHLMMPRAIQRTTICTRARAWAQLMFLSCRQHHKHTADCRLARCGG